MKMKHQEYEHRPFGSLWSPLQDFMRYVIPHRSGAEIPGHKDWELKMKHEEFERRLAEEVESGDMTPDQMNDLLEQKSRFDAERLMIEEKYKGMVVGFVAGQMEVGKTVHEVLDQAESHFPNKMVYFEPVGFTLF